MEVAPKRPASVWMTQVLVAIAILFGVITLPLRLWSLGGCVVDGSAQSCAGVAVLSVLRDVLLCGLAVVTFRGLNARQGYGRQLGIGFLILLAIAATAQSPYIQLLYGAIASGQPLPPPPYECWQSSVGQIQQEYCGYASYTELGLRTALDAVFPSSVVAWLAIRLASSPAANSFFKR